eukprot:TRINITY_DN3060_c0_g1_i1.p1 TRINITY_DN3060_c0_g1~~TRINITY_DN3060_c0_g1_i1.p1  ORF type:complete len:1870 (+),score=510.82 TRINITY_DN3060_c0_g1_i1:771-5612(+)
MSELILHTVSKALFRVQRASPDLYIILRMEKILQSEYDTGVDPYVRHDAKNLDRLRTEAKEFTRRLGEYRQMFAWAATPLFVVDDAKQENIGSAAAVAISSIVGMAGSSKQLPLADSEGGGNSYRGRRVQNISVVSTRTLQLYKHKQDSSDSSLMDAVFEMKTQPKKLRPIVGNIVLTISEWNESELAKVTKDILTPSLEPLLSTPKRVALATSPGSAEVEAEAEVLEIQEFFPVEREVAIPHLTHCNNLYLYPENLNFVNYHSDLKHSARNIAIRVSLRDNDADITQPGLKNIYSTFGVSLTHSVTSSVFYHSKTPSYPDEFKILLPVSLNPAHHILFTFFHVSCKYDSRDKEKDAEVPLGYAWLPLADQGCLLPDDVYTLPVCHYPAAGSTESYTRPEERQWIDGKRALFRVRVRAATSLHPQDPYIAPFLNWGVNPTADLTPVANMRKLEKGKREAVKFMPIILRTFENIIVSGTPESKHEALLSLAAFASVLPSNTQTQQASVQTIVQRNPLLSTYAQYVFNPFLAEKEEQPDTDSTTTFHFQLVSTWLECLQKGEEISSLVSVEFSYFLFSVISKSMVLHLRRRKLLNAPCDTLENFLGEYYSRLTKLCVCVGKDTATRMRSAVRAERDIALEQTRNVALFCKDLMSLMDRAVVFQIISQHMSQASGVTDDAMRGRFEFLAPILDHAHYIQLNNPTLQLVSSIPSLVDEYAKVHFLSGLLENELEMALFNPSFKTRTRSTKLLLSLLVKHDTDPRVQPSDFGFVGSMYLPYLLLITTNRETAFSPEPSDDVARDQKNIAACLLWILKNINKQVLISWWKLEHTLILIDFLRLLNHCLECFKYEGASEITKKKQMQVSRLAIEQMYSSSDVSARKGTTRQHAVAREKFAQAGTGGSSRERLATDADANAAAGAGSVRLRGTARGGALATAATAGGKPVVDSRAENLSCTEASFIVLDTLALFCNVFAGDLTDEQQGSSALLQPVFDVLFEFLAPHQSFRLLDAALAFLRHFVPAYRTVLFSNAGSLFCRELTRRVLSLCNFRNKQTRIDAAQLLYIMIRNNYEVAGHFLRMRVVLTTSLSEVFGVTTALFGEENSIRLQALQDETFFRRTLEVMSFCAKKDNSVFAVHSKDVFVKQLHALTQSLDDILKDFQELEKNKDDNEMIADLYYRVAERYTSTPDLRLTLIKNLASVFQQSEKWAEAGVCMTHAAALVSEYLSLKRENIQHGVPNGCSALAPVFKTVRYETHPPELADDDNICHSEDFSITGLIEILDRAITLLEQAEMFESCNQLFKFVLPIHEFSRDYAKIGDAHRRLKTMFSRIAQLDAKQARTFGTYYRVGFYGSKFGEMDGKEYIYREDKLTHLYEIKARLKALYQEKFGENVNVMPDSKPVDRATLNPKECHIQITSVEPYFSSSETKERVTYFERNTDLRQFSYETPFTRTGTARGDIGDQCIRKSILSVQDPFPCMKRRQLVQSRQTIELEPIEVAVEAMKKQTEKISNLLNISQEEDQLKSLQAALQGSVLLQVNAGPKEFCRVFLGNPAKFPEDAVENLRAAFRDFFIACREGLRINGSRVKQEQLAFHAGLESGFQDMLSKIGPYLIVCSSIY